MVTTVIWPEPAEAQENQTVPALPRSRPWGGLEKPMVAKMEPTAVAADTDTDEEDGAGGVEGSNKHTPRIRKPWHDTEDATLRALVNVLSVGRWADLARQMGTDRTGKQCRERWHNPLSPAVDKNEWREEEDRAIAEGVARMGPKCAPLHTNVVFSRPLLSDANPNPNPNPNQGARLSSCSLAAPTMRSRTGGTPTSAR